MQEYCNHWQPQPMKRCGLCGEWLGLCMSERTVRAIVHAHNFSVLVCGMERYGPRGSCVLVRGGR